MVKSRTQRCYANASTLWTFVLRFYLSHSPTITYSTAWIRSLQPNIQSSTDHRIVIDQFTWARLKDIRHFNGAAVLWMRNIHNKYNENWKLRNFTEHFKTLAKYDIVKCCYFWFIKCVLCSDFWSENCHFYGGWGIQNYSSESDTLKSNPNTETHSHCLLFTVLKRYDPEHTNNAVIDANVVVVANIYRLAHATLCKSVSKAFPFERLTNKTGTWILLTPSLNATIPFLSNTRNE